MKTIQKHSLLKNPRFVWLIGDICEAFTDIDLNEVSALSKNANDMLLWDRQEKKIVVRVSPDYAQAFCLETTRNEDAPFTLLEAWFNTLPNSALESEHLTPTRKEFQK